MPPLNPGDRVLVLTTVDDVRRDALTFSIAPGDSWVIGADAWAYPLDEATVERLAMAARYAYLDGEGWPVTKDQLAMWSSVVRAIIAELIGETP